MTRMLVVTVIIAVGLMVGIAALLVALRVF